MATKKRKKKKKVQKKVAKKAPAKRTKTKRKKTKLSAAKDKKKAKTKTKSQKKTKASTKKSKNKKTTNQTTIKSISTTDPVQLYLAEIRKYDLLTKEQEKKLAVEYFESKNPEAAERLVTSNLRFVVKIAAEYSKFGAKMIDLIQEGNVGLMHAVKEFNPYKGVRLITYAVWWIRGYIQEFLMRQYSMVRIGTTQNQRKLFYQLQREQEELRRLGFTEGIKLLSGKLNIPEKEVAEMAKRMGSRDVSLDQPIGHDNSSTLIDLQKEDYEVAIDDELGNLEEIEILRKNIEKIRPDLNEREIYLLENRLLSDSPKTLQEIGDNYNITREAVRQMESRLLKKIKQKVVEEI